AARLARAALCDGGPAKLEPTEDAGSPPAPWRPHHVLHYMQSIPFEPTFVVDVTSVWDRRVAALQAFESQFFVTGRETDYPETFIAITAFLAWGEARARTYGYRVGATYGEPFLCRHGPVGVTDLMAVLGRERPFR